MPTASWVTRVVFPAPSWEGGIMPWGVGATAMCCRMASCRGRAGLTQAARSRAPSREEGGPAYSTGLHPHTSIRTFQAAWPS